MELLQGATPIYEGSCRLTFLERQEVWNDCRSYKVRVGSNGNLLWEASVFLGRKKGREDVVKFSTSGSGAIRKLLDVEGIIMEGLNRRQSPWMKLFSEYSFEAKYHLGKANVVVESWSRKKSEAKNEF
ncbi:hypothetical protein Tco_1082528 [Tanacetum coccineum]|uniref:Reverse transcriptase n=1 Tax=Tanacetum coccineum TaxID=301880 RepID=A0ABQ5I2R5_9ASTR